MSLNSEITRLQNAKSTLKTKLNARNDNQHQIDSETIDEYGDFVDSIPSGGRDWSEIGYSSEPDIIADGINYAKQIMQNWDSTQTNYSNKFSSNFSLIFMPTVSTSNGTNFYNMFYNCKRLIYIPQIDTSNGTNFYGMFGSCDALKKISLIDTSSGTAMGSMFDGCTSLTTIPQIDTSNNTNFYSMFRGCSSLTTVPTLNMSSATNINDMFYPCSILENLGGLTNLGQAYSTSQSANYNSYKLDLSTCSLLTHDSLMNVINGLYDIATKGCNTQQLVIGSTNLAKLTAEEIAIATNKGWTVS